MINALLVNLSLTD